MIIISRSRRFLGIRSTAINLGAIVIACTTCTIIVGGCIVVRRHRSTSSSSGNHGYEFEFEFLGLSEVWSFLFVLLSVYNLV